MRPTILIEDEVYKKIMYWVNKSDYEISGLGMVKVEPNGILRVVSTMLLPQENGSTHTDIEADEVNKALYQLRESDGELRWWWHSHVKMGVFWSGTDHDTIKKIGAGGWMAATVFNQKNECKSCYYAVDGQKTPWGHESLMLDDLKTEYTVPADAREPLWLAEYEANVKIKQPVWEGRHYAGKSSTPTTSGASTAGKGRLVDQYDAAVCPPKDKPKYMSRKAFKEWGEAHTKYTMAHGFKAVEGMGRSLIESTQGDLTLLPPPKDPVIVKAMEADAYGFIQEERSFLAEEGWSDKDIDELLRAGLDSADIVSLATWEIHPSELKYMFLNGYSASDVQEMLQNCVDTGIDFFNNPRLYQGRNYQ